MMKQPTVMRLSFGSSFNGENEKGVDSILSPIVLSTNYITKKLYESKRKKVYKLGQETM